MAATYVEDAVQRRCIKLDDTADALQAWRAYNSPILLFIHQLALIVIFLLLLIEDPAVAKLDIEPNYFIPIIIEVLILAFFSYRLHQLRVAQGTEEWKKPKNLVFCLCIAVSLKIYHK